MNPGQFANVQSDVSGLGDTYLRFYANALVSSDPGAPTFSQLLIVPELDLPGNVAGGPVTIDRVSDVDYDGSGQIDSGTTEDGNANFNAENNNYVAICLATGARIATPDGHRCIETLTPGSLVTTLDRVRHASRLWAKCPDRDRARRFG